MALLITVGAVAALLFWAGRPDYRLLYADLSLEDAAVIREKLEDERIPLEIKNSGRTIFVPAGDVYRARLLLASEGLPKDTTAGFELFEEPKFGLTEFAQRVNYQRALQGELERTISTMDGIERARVILVLPKDKLFATEEERKGSASIMLSVSGGFGVNQSQVASITHLVASAVPALEPGSITVSDQTGRLLSSSKGPADSSAVQANDQLAAKEKTEQMLTDKAQTMLDHAMGTGRSIVRIDVDMDFSKIEKRIENYDAENKTVRSEVIESESSTSPGGSGGSVAGVVANIPVGTPQQGSIEGEMSKRKKENITTEYAIPSDVQMISTHGARVKQISAAVCVAQGENPRTADELKKIEGMVSRAVGLVNNETRQDYIEVTEMPFPEIEKAAPMPWWGQLPVPVDVLMRGLLGALLLLIVYLVSRKVMAGLVVQREEAGVPVEALAPGGAPAERELGRGMRPEEEELVVDALDEVRTIAEQNPKAIAAWITSMAAPE
jgi:flagellar M-ring protein FliF